MTDDSTTPPPPPEQPYSGQPAAAPAPLSESEGRTYATLAHAGIAASAVVGVTIFAPLVIWLIAKDRSAYVNEQGKEALNFSILITILYIVGWVTIWLFIGFLFLAAAWIGAVVFGIIAAIAANKGENYRYPINWRIVK